MMVMTVHKAHVLLIIILNTLHIKLELNEPRNYYMQRLNDDFHHCPKCFHQMEQRACKEFYKQLEEIVHINNLISIIMQSVMQRQRDLKWLRLKDTELRLIGKYMRTEKGNGTLKKSLNKWQFCPEENVSRFVQTLQSDNNLSTAEITWFYLNIDIQLVLLPILKELNFPVPSIYKRCGFSLFQHNAGQTLTNFYQAEFPVKLKITQQLLQAGVKFSYGFQGYRLYITDLTPDNIVYDDKRNILSFIDLNTVFIVDSLQVKLSTLTHRHEYEMCSGCFSFIPSELCLHNVSDVNLFLICQILMEDLYGDPEKGFLYPIPLSMQHKYPNFLVLLKHCMMCPRRQCQHRFPIIEQLLSIIKDILENHY